jgi:hypothetical protein
MDSPVQVLISARPWEKLTEEAEPDPPLLRVTVIALAIGLLGFAWPWYTVAYTPPGGSITVHGHALTAFIHTYSGFSPEQGGLMQAPLGPYSFGEQVIPGAQLTGILLKALIAVCLATALAWPALAPIKAPVLKVLRLRWTQLGVNVAHAVALLIEAVGCLSFLLLALGIGGIGARIDFAQALGNTPYAHRVAQYLHISIGAGFWLVLISVLILVAARAKQFFTTIAVILAGLLVLYILHADGWIGPFLHSFGF